MWGVADERPTSTQDASAATRAEHAVAFVEEQRRVLRDALAADRPPSSPPRHCVWLDVVRAARDLGGEVLAELAGDLYALHGHMVEVLERPPEVPLPDDVADQLRQLRCAALDERTAELVDGLRAAAVGGGS